MKFRQIFLHPILKLYAWINNIYLYNFDDDLKKSGEEFIKDFKKSVEIKKSLLPLIEENISKIDSWEVNWEIKSQKIYNLEYSESNYSFLNALLVDNIFESIVGISKIKLKSLKIIDVGAGSGELELFLLNIGCPASSIFCIDTSSASIERINKIGIHGRIGTLNNAGIENNSFDVTFLSYFIEYDTAQSDTFHNAVRVTKSSGTIVLEAFLASCLRFTKNNKTVSRGYFLLDDIDRIKKSFFNHGRKLNKDCKLKKISVGHRWVYSHYGLCRLPSIFLTFKIS